MQLRDKERIEKEMARLGYIADPLERHRRAKALERQGKGVFASLAHLAEMDRQLAVAEIWEDWWNKQQRQLKRPASLYALEDS